MDSIDEAAARSIMRAFGVQAYQHAEGIARKWELQPNLNQAAGHAHRWHRIANAIARLEAEGATNGQVLDAGPTRLDVPA